MERIVAYCGIVCSDCKGYLATQADDWSALEAVAAEARANFGVADATAESVRCDGCLSATGVKIGYCSACAIRACGVQKGVANCAHCADYGTCETLQGFLTHASGAKETLDAIRAGL